PERPKTLSICSVARSPRWYCCRTLRNASRRWVSAPLPVRPRSSPLTSRRNQPNGDGLFARPRSTSTDAFSRADELWRAPRNRGRTDSEGRRRCVLQTHSVTPRFWQSKALLSAVELDVFTVLVGPSRRSQTPKQKSSEIPRAGPTEHTQEYTGELAAGAAHPRRMQRCHRDPPRGQSRRRDQRCRPSSTLIRRGIQCDPERSGRARADHLSQSRDHVRQSDRFRPAVRRIDCSSLRPTRREGICPDQIQK